MGQKSMYSLNHYESQIIATQLKGTTELLWSFGKYKYIMTVLVIAT